LLKLLQSTSDEHLQFEALAALRSVAPTSALSANAIVALLARPYSDSYYYRNIVAACGDFGELAQNAVPHLTALLQHQDEGLRSESVEALGKIGNVAQPAVGSLIEIIVSKEEAISTKNRAAVAIRKIGLTAIEPLIVALQTSDPDAQESILRAVSIIGSRAVLARATVLAILGDDHRSMAVRSAAALAVGAMGENDTRLAQRILRYCDERESEIVRSACLIAASQIDPASAKSMANQLTQDTSMLLRASAAYSLHLCGESRQGFDLLIRMLNDVETDEVIRQTLRDFGPVIDRWLVEVASDTTSNPEARTTCFWMACEVASPPWHNLLPLVDDYDLGEEFAAILEGYWHNSVAEGTHDMAAEIETLLTILESKSLTPVARARMAGLLSPDGLGAGEVEEDWQGITLSKPLSTKSLVANRESAAASAPAPAPNEDPPKPTPTPSELPRPTISIQPKKPIRAQAAEQRAIESPRPKEVAVFYGTNRSRDLNVASWHDAATPVVASITGSLGIMLFSIVGLWRSGNRTFAVVALLAMGFVVPMSLMVVQSAWLQESQSVAYGVDYRDTTEYGVCHVSIPPDHKPGELEAPSLLRLEVKSDPKKHVMVTQIEQLSPDLFFEDLQSMQSKKGKNLLVFIHGYNVSFEDAARRTAQMSCDLAFPGAPVFFSWPSQANWYGYGTDQENIQLSVNQIKGFLLDLVERSGAETINLVAHSMGNVGLTEALKEIQTTKETPLFNQVVLAAPDIDADVFKHRVAPHIVGKAKQVTLYTSQSDLALVASRYFNHGQRVGDSGPEALLFPGIDTIDATAVDSSLLGHSYYGDSVSVLTDLGQLLRNQPIVNRRYLQQMMSNGKSAYWAFDPMRISKTLDTSIR
jgi:esterase/lipase superfamily enzyme/HEAT repeat protein